MQKKCNAKQKLQRKQTAAQKELQRETIKFVKRYYILPGPITHKDKFKGVPSNSIGFSARFKNLRKYTVSEKGVLCFA